MEESKQSDVLEALEALKAASKDVEANSDESGCDSPSMKALLELETGSVDLLDGDPKLTALSSLLSRLKSLASSLKPNHRCGGGLRSLIRRRSGGSEISRVAGSIGSELQSWIDRQSIDQLISPSTPDEEKSALLAALESRLAQGFDRDLQDILLRSGAFSAVESLLSDPSSSEKVRDRAASAILAFVRFNKSVFVGEVLMGPTGPTVASLVRASTAASIRALSGLIAAIRSPLVDQLHADGWIAGIIALLSHPGEVKAAAFDAALEIGYYGRKEAVDEMMGRGLIERLAELQVSEGRPFASGVARFAVQMEVGEGLRQREKRALKLEVLRRVRAAAAVSDAEAATIVAEVLWGPTSW